MPWQKYSCCLNCGTATRPHRGKGFCNLCYGPAMQVAEVRNWEQQEPSTLRRYPGTRPELDDPTEFELLRQGYLHELQTRLDWVRHWEQTWDDSVDGISIEYQLGRIARYAGAADRNLFYGYANTVDWNFPPDQKKLLRQLLGKIELDRPWRGVNLMRVYEYREGLRKRRRTEG